MDTEAIIQQFKKDYQFRFEHVTLKNYQYYLRHFFKHTGKSFNDITKSDIRYWMVALKEKGYNPVTIWTKLTGIKTFFKYCWEEGYILTNPAKDIPFPKVEEKLPNYLTHEQWKKLRKLVSGNIQQRALVEVLYTTGIRNSELCAMKKEHIQWSERIIHIPKGKRKKGRIVLFTRECEEYLKAHLDSRHVDMPYVFESIIIKNRPITPHTVQRLFSKEYSKKLGFRVTPHTLRHTFAAHLAQKGMPLEGIQALLGHDDPRTTRYYARLYEQAQKEMYDQFM